MARFIDLFVIGDGEQSLPALCDEWLRLKHSQADRESMLFEMAKRLPFAYVPQFYRPQFDAQGRTIAVRPHPGLADQIQPATVDLESIPLPVAPVVPHVECVQERMAVEIIRGCPGKCRFCRAPRPRARCDSAPWKP